MDDSQKERAIAMVEQLKESATSCGVLLMREIVVMRCPGSPYTDTPTTFDEIDLEHAISLGLLRKQRIVAAMNGNITSQQDCDGSFL